MEEWTFEEKKKMLEILYKLGASNYELIHKHMPDKSVDQIQLFCEKYMQRAMRRWEQSQITSESDAALKHWLMILKKTNTQSGCITNIIPRVLKYIALFEKRTVSSNIDLSECYMMLSSLCEGFAAQKVDEIAESFSSDCLLILAKTVKLGGNQNIINFLTNKSNFDVVKTQNLKKGAFSDVVNPLHVSDKLLEMNSFELNTVIFD